MNPRNVRSPTSHSVWLAPLVDAPALVAGPAELRLGDEGGEYTVTQGKCLVSVRLTAARPARALDALLGSGRARLATIDQIAHDRKSLQMTIRFFNGKVVELGELDVGIDDRAYESARRLIKGNADFAAVARLLGELCALRLGPSPDDGYFLLTAGAAAKEEFDVLKAGGGIPSANADLQVSETERAFCVHGDGIRISVARKKLTSDETRYLVTRLTSSIGAGADGAVRLAHGRVTFSDFTRTGPVQAIAAGAMARLMEGEKGYLKKWDEYGEEEGKLLLDRARKIGALRWAQASQLPRGAVGVELHFSDALPETLSEGDELEFAADLPAYLRQVEMTWAEYLRLLEEEAQERLKGGKQHGFGNDPADAQGRAEPGNVAKVLEVSGTSLVLDLLATPDRDDLHLVLSLSGDRAQIERRMAARKRVLEGRSANPMLGVIIEEHGEPPEPTHLHPVKPLSAFVVEKVFKRRPPTPAQEEAIRIALNTPDIALIQGPPGTGKTTVIAAIVERLNELTDKERSFQGEVLVSAFQHDAIENMMARLTVNSIPVPKFGRRSGTFELGDRNAEKMRRWSSDVAASVRARNPKLRVPEKLLAAGHRCREYILAPSIENALGTIDAVINVPDGHLSAALLQAATALRARLEGERSGRHVQEDAEVLRGLWSLRTTLVGFQDDGPAMAQVLLDQPAVELLPAERALLGCAAGWRTPDLPPFLDELRQLKAVLLERYRPQATFRLDKPRTDVLEFVEQAAQQLRSASQGSKRERILAEFLQELEGNPAATQRAVEDYGFVFAATCQQSQGKAITKRKLRTALVPGQVDYDTVIIDEAARSSPRDLLIPMVQARRRIILVGDHRQLPHMIDEEIAKALEARDANGDGESAAKREESYVRRSMFQYLLSRLKQLQARDQIPRWVTLDQQFRMHPLLGNFVSDHFYRVHDPLEAFGSPTPAGHFTHGLARIPEVPAAWIDVPARLGEEDRGGTSWRRAPEAREIAKWIERWIDTPAGRRLTFGVISFYKSQVDKVFQALETGGYTTRDESGKWRIADGYSLRPEEEGLPPEERLRIGTVDSFQGMEFDVVFLSMVRSRRRLPDPPASPAELLQLERSIYGHLTSPNRLCVSMSRQKRLLVVVGDKALVEHELARGAVPGLVGFLRLCETHGAVFGVGD